MFKKEFERLAIESAGDTIEDPYKRSLLSRAIEIGLMTEEEFPKNPDPLPSSEEYFILACFILLHFNEEF